MRKLTLALAAFTLLLLFFPAKAAAEITFKDVTAEVGLIEPLRGMFGHGAAWGDVNGDGYPDLFFGHFADRDGLYPPPDKLFINNSGHSFTELLDSPVRVKGRNSGAAFADLDNDGDLDLVVSHNAVEYEPPGPIEICQEGNHIYRNDGEGNMTDMTANSNLNFGIPFTGRSTFVLDYDGDGRLDLFMEEDWVLATLSGGNSRLMRNLGNFVFEDVTNQAGIPDGVYGLGGAVGDLNGDSWPDLYIAHIDRLYLNNKNGTFREKQNVFFDPQYSLPAGQNLNWPCGADIGDLDNDGDLDLVIGEHFVSSSDHRLRVFLNTGNNGNGDPVFQEITDSAGIRNLGTKQPHVQIEDFNNDGLLDILTSVQSALVYKNIGVSGGIPHFTGPVGSSPAGGLIYWPAAPVADFDRDGKLDIIGAQWDPGAHSPLLKNITPGAGDFIDIRIDAPGSGVNHHGIGATVRIYQPGQAGQPEALLGMKAISVSNGYSSGSPAIAHFGVPGYSAVDVVVIMPNEGPTYIASSQPTNRLVTITGNGITPPTPSSTPTLTPANPYDLDDNGQVNAADILILLQNWRNGSQGDFNNDGKVNSLDFGLLIANWAI